MSKIQHKNILVYYTCQQMKFIKFIFQSLLDYILSNDIPQVYCTTAPFTLTCFNKMNFSERMHYSVLTVPDNFTIHTDSQARISVKVLSLNHDMHTLFLSMGAVFTLKSDCLSICKFLAIHYSIHQYLNQFSFFLSNKISCQRYLLLFIEVLKNEHYNYNSYKQNVNTVGLIQCRIYCLLGVFNFEHEIYKIFQLILCECEVQISGQI